MKEILRDLTTFFAGVISWIPIIAKATLGVIGEFLDTIGYVKAIIIGIVGAISIAIRWIWKKLNR